MSGDSFAAVSVPGGHRLRQPLHFEYQYFCLGSLDSRVQIKIPANKWNKLIHTNPKEIEQECPTTLLGLYLLLLLGAIPHPRHPCGNLHPASKCFDLRNMGNQSFFRWLQSHSFNLTCFPDICSYLKDFNFESYERSFCSNQGESSSHVDCWGWTTTKGSPIRTTWQYDSAREKSFMVFTGSGHFALSQGMHAISRIHKKKTGKKEKNEKHICWDGNVGWESAIPWGKTWVPGAVGIQ